MDISVGLFTFLADSTIDTTQDFSGGFEVVFGLNHLLISSSLSFLLTATSIHQSKVHLRSFIVGP